MRLIKLLILILQMLCEPTGGILSNNLGIEFNNNLLMLSKFEKNVGNYTLEIVYTLNDISSSIIYTFTILPYIYYNNILSLSFTDNFNTLSDDVNTLSEIPTVFPLSGKFTFSSFNLNLNNNLFHIDEIKGTISCNKLFHVVSSDRFSNKYFFI